MWVEPVMLEGEHVRMEPMGEEHLAELWKAGSDADLWRYMPTVIESEEHMRGMIGYALQHARQGTGQAFVTILKEGNQVVGSSGYWNIDAVHKRLEIGYTWITKKWQRSAVNTEAKLLMMQHAFETLGCIRVEFKTDSLNERSRAAIARIGAREEGTFRNHMIQPDGRYRHSVYFSVTDDEWPQVKTRLLGYLKQHADR